MFDSLAAGSSYKLFCATFQDGGHFYCSTFGGGGGINSFDTIK